MVMAHMDTQQAAGCIEREGSSIVRLIEEY